MPDSQSAKLWKQGCLLVVSEEYQSLKAHQHWALFPFLRSGLETPTHPFIPLLHCYSSINWSCFCSFKEVFICEWCCINNKSSSTWLLVPNISGSGKCWPPKLMLDYGPSSLSWVCLVSQHVIYASQLMTSWLMPFLFGQTITWKLQWSEVREQAHQFCCSSACAHRAKVTMHNVCLTH